MPGAYAGCSFSWQDVRPPAASITSSTITNSGIWKRSNQTALLDLLIGGEIAGALWEGGDTRLGKTFWQSIDSSAIGAVSSEALKHIFTRSRPDQSLRSESLVPGVVATTAFPAAK